MSVSLACSCLSCPTHRSPRNDAGPCRRYPSSSMTDAQWALIEPLLRHRGTPVAGVVAGRSTRAE